MSISVSKDSGQLTLTIEFTGDETKMESELDLLTEDLWVSRYGNSYVEDKLVSVDTLTNAERLALINRWIKDEAKTRIDRQDKRDRVSGIDDLVAAEDHGFE